MERCDWEGSSHERGPVGLARRIRVWKWWIVGASATVMLGTGLGLMLATPSYRAEAQVLIGTKATGLIGLRSHILYPERDSSPSPVARSQVQLVASRDLARRAIKDLGIEAKPEFDPLARGLGPASRALVLLGLKRDPARLSPQERILQAYEERLSVTAAPEAKLVTIAFRSEDSQLAAAAANRIADLFIEMRGKPGEAPRTGIDARIVSRAKAPSDPMFPPPALLAIVGFSASLMTAFGTFAFGAYHGKQPKVRAGLESAEPHPIGPLPVLAGVPDEQAPILTSTPAPTPLEPKENLPPRGMEEIAKHILARHDGSAGLCIAMTCAGAIDLLPQKALTLGRELGRAGYTIVVGLDPAEMFEHGASTAQDSPGFTEVIAGTASFAQAIRRDPASRLHFVPTGRDGTITFEESESFIETLAGIYDFVLLLVPPLDRGELSRILAAKANFVVLDASMPHNPAALCDLRGDLIAEGVREVLTIGEVPRLRRRAEPNPGPNRPVAVSRETDASSRLRRRAFPSI
jgi:capsular polysaccharide biosynthesis protein